MVIPSNLSMPVTAQPRFRLLGRAGPSILDTMTSQCHELYTWSQTSAMMCHSASERHAHKTYLRLHGLTEEGKELHASLSKHSSCCGGSQVTF